MEMKKVLLLVGSTGVLGTFFTEKFSDKYIIVGAARRKPAGHVLYDFYEADIGDSACVAKLVDYTLQKYGKIDILINNAVLYDMRELRDKDSKVFERELKVNVIAPLTLTNYVMNHFWAKKTREENEKYSRNVLNVSSIAGSKLYAHTGKGTYSVAKAALDMLTRHMAEEYIAFGIRANAIAPNSFPSFVPLERIGEAMLSLMEGKEDGVIKILD